MPEQMDLRITRFLLACTSIEEAVLRPNIPYSLTSLIQCQHIADDIDDTDLGQRCLQAGCSIAEVRGCVRHLVV